MQYLGSDSVHQMFLYWSLKRTPDPDPPLAVGVCAVVVVVVAVGPYKIIDIGMKRESLRERDMNGVKRRERQKIIKDNEKSGSVRNINGTKFMSQKV